MFELSSTAGLWALTAVSLPLAIHLWRPPPRTVKLGSLRFLGKLPRIRLRQLRWRERALLVARLALLCLLALLVAGLKWRPPQSDQPQRWVLLDPAATPDGEAVHRLRALQASGYRLHALAPGFPLRDSLPDDENGGANDAPADLWSLLREADAELPEGSCLAVVTPGRISSLRGKRPAMRHVRVDWIPAAAGDQGTRSWIESVRATKLPGQALDCRPLVGKSDAAATRFHSARLSDGGFEVAPDASRLRLSGSPPGEWVTMNPRASPLRVTIFHDADRADDAHYIRAAVNAVGATSGLPVSVLDHPLATGETLVARYEVDWVFWLSARAVPAAIAEGAPNLVCDAAVPPSDLPSTAAGWIVTAPGEGDAVPPASPIRLWRRTPSPTLGPNEQVLWTDGFGTPLLTRTTASHQTRWNFGSRFHPDWNALPSTPALAVWVRELLLPGSRTLPAEPAHDQRRADPTQYSVSVERSRATDLSLPRPMDARDLHWLLWFFAASMFAVERFLSHGRRAVTEQPMAAPVRSTAVLR